MPYLIDGHNLIPYLPGMSLADPDDELSLIQLLQGFARQRNVNVEVFFDRASPIQSRRKDFARVTAIFIREGSTADSAIRKRLNSLKKRAKNWTVVSSDQEVRSSAKQAQARMLTSGEFAKQLTRLDREEDPGEPEKETPDLSESDLDYWLEQFSTD